MKQIALLVMLSALFTTAGCSPETVTSATKDVQRNTEIVEREANRVEKKARPAIAAAKKQVEPGLQKLDLGARATAALKLNRNLPQTIRVDADTDGIRLRGSVRTKEEKALAERIARDTLPADAKLRNELEVAQ
ncbi:MAG: BON domain-containing protein [Akkermansiaceae bacterium]|nr:BON domain-containing protein [Armatimonadota bacterium]